MASVAVIDIGSNSIKCLVAERGERGAMHLLHEARLDARISAGISQANPRLTEASMQRGLAAIEELLRGTAAFAPERTVLVATSAVRDAQNSTEFRERVRKATGYPIRLLSGDEEANLIGRGLTCDPALVDLRDFYVFDLGGGSLECLAYRARHIEQAVSLPLGCVRLTERFVPEPDQPIPDETLAAIGRHTQATLREAGFSFSLPADASVVVTGGTATTVRMIRAARESVELEATDTTIHIADLRGLMSDLAAMPLARRKSVAGLPPERADVFPAALATVIALSEAGGFEAFRHSVYNLKFGLAAEALGAG